MKTLTALFILAVAVSMSIAPAAAVGSAPATAVAPTFEQLVGQKLVVRMATGTTPSADLLGRITRGEIGGVILFAANVTTRTALHALTAKLQGAATAGHQPRLLIAVDQEGGIVKRIPWAPPTMSALAMGRTGSASVARSQGSSTGAALHALGINVDLAPVADVPASTASFMYRDARTFSFSSTTTAVLADAFATGLRSNGVDATMKHFPGIGFATRNTDLSTVTITASRTALAPGLRPYVTGIAHGLPLVMFSNATYAAYDTINGAGWSHAIVETLLRHDLGFKGVTITDALNAAAATRHISSNTLATRASIAGTDLILLTGSESSTRSVYATLLAQAKSGAISAATLASSYNRILALKAALPTS